MTTRTQRQRSDQMPREDALNPKCIRCGQSTVYTSRICSFCQRPGEQSTKASERRREEPNGERCDLIEAAAALLHRIDTMTSADFSVGGDRVERERLRKALMAAGRAI